MSRLFLAIPLLAAVTLGACASNGVQPGYVNRPPQQAGYSQYPQNQGYPPQTYTPGNAGSYQQASANGPVAGTTPLDPNDPANQQQGYPSAQPAASSGNVGRVVSINEVALQGTSPGGGSGGLIGGLLGAAGGAAIGASGGRGLGGGIIGGLLGAVGGAIAGTIFDQQGGTASGGRGIEVTVQKDDGQTVTVAQRDDGDVQLGDRVQIVQNRNGVPKVVRDTSRNRD